MSLRPLAITAATVLSLLAVTAPALARASDRDHDGMPDRWEHRHHVSRPGLDPDRDGLSNVAEYRLGSDPHRADTDRDGVSDGREDFDRDGVDNRDELRDGTDPRREDAGTDTPPAGGTCEPTARAASHGGPEHPGGDDSSSGGHGSDDALPAGADVPAPASDDRPAPPAEDVPGHDAGPDDHAAGGACPR